VALTLCGGGGVDGCAAGVAAGGVEVGGVDGCAAGVAAGGAEDGGVPNALGGMPTIVRWMLRTAAGCRAGCDAAVVGVGAVGVGAVGVGAVGVGAAVAMGDEETDAVSIGLPQLPQKRPSMGRDA
jgi:hypothetical protein